MMKTKLDVETTRAAMFEAFSMAEFLHGSKRAEKKLQKAIGRARAASLAALQRRRVIREGPPTLPAKLTASGHGVTVWCKYCRRNHHHGIGEDGTLAGHRAAHCDVFGDSPYVETGYILDIIRPPV
jgi:hypothetical protein